MSIAKSVNNPVNRLLAALPLEEYQRLLIQLEYIELELGKVLYQPGEAIDYVYFPHDSLISLVMVLQDGSTAEVGLVSGSGMAGISVILGSAISFNQAIVQVAGSAMRMRTEHLNAALKQGGKLQGLLLRYVQALLSQVSQTAACNRLHTIEARLARWLLLVQDAIHSDELQLTQEFIAQMLGVRRAGVTVTASALQQAGLIHYSRGKITVLHRKGLEAVACECYQRIEDEYDRLLNLDTVLKSMQEP